VAKKSFTQKTSDNVAKGAMAGVLDQLFQDMYANRWQIYKLNFLRGLFFALGGVIGGTILVVVLVWLLSLFDHIPIIGHFVETIRHSLESTRSAQ
jgi:hypothetical protein